MIQEKILIVFLMLLLCCYVLTINVISLLYFYFCYLQIDGHDSGTESDGDLDTEDFNERDIELSEYYAIVVVLLLMVQQPFLFLLTCF